MLFFCRWKNFNGNTYLLFEWEFNEKIYVMCLAQCLLQNEYWKALASITSLSKYIL